MSSDDRKVYQAIFKKETERAERARLVAEDDDISLTRLKAEYKNLAAQYAKLVRESIKITRIGDATHAKLIKLQHQLEAQNFQIEGQKEELERLNRKLMDVSRTDSLTLLRNRRFLTEFLEAECNKIDEASRSECGYSSEESMIFLLIDVDFFKVINDTHGHLAGDRVLIQLGELLQSFCRKSDILVRWGGEEFLMVCRESNHGSGADIAERIRSRVEAQALDIGDGQTLSCRCSIGFSPFPFLESEPLRFTWEQVVAVADQGLYAAKNSGRNAWVGIFPNEDADWSLIKPSQLLETPEVLYHQGGIQVESLVGLDMINWQQRTAALESHKE